MGMKRRKCCEVGCDAECYGRRCMACYSKGKGRTLSRNKNVRERNRSKKL